MKHTTIILIDEPIKYDLRVQKIVKEYNNPLIINCADIYTKPYTLQKTVTLNIFNIFKSFIFAPINFYKLTRNHKLQLPFLISGFKTSMTMNLNSLKVFHFIKDKYNLNNIELIYANDLFCGLIGVHISKHIKCALTYNAHEVEFHRNRKNSFVRTNFDIYLEKKVIRTANKIIVVNKKIEELYINLYDISTTKLFVIDNNHFIPHIKYALNTFDSQNISIMIVYIGSAINNRKLDSLADESKKFNVDVSTFFLADIPKFTLTSNWLLGKKDYLKDFLTLVSNKRCIMWCCTENICLSYQLSLPNKFFQAIAIGIPIIAYKETYLSQIVQKYELGYIYDDTNFNTIKNNLNNTEKYYKLMRSVYKFQKKLFTEGIIL